MRSRAAFGSTIGAGVVSSHHTTDPALHLYVGNVHGMDCRCRNGLHPGTQRRTYAPSGSYFSPCDTGLKIRK